MKLLTVSHVKPRVKKRQNIAVIGTFMTLHRVLPCWFVFLSSVQHTLVPGKEMFLAPGLGWSSPTMSTRPRG